MKLNYPLSILGQQPGLQGLYTQITCCYSVDNDASHSAIVDTLKTGLERLSESFPWIAGQTVKQHSASGRSEITIVPLDNTPRLVVKDLRNDPAVPTMDEYRRARFPFRLLDENIIAPRNTLTIPGVSQEVEAPVFLIQANFISGGLLLTFQTQHNVMDMTGQGHIMDMLSKACHNEPFTAEELSTGNLNQLSVFGPLDDPGDLSRELAHQIAKPSPTPDPDPPAPAEASWDYFLFDSASLATLKSLASQTMTTGYVSTDDALSAFIWQSVSRARLPRLGSEAETTFARAVDPRRHLNLPKTYPGLVTNMTYHTLPLQELTEQPLGSIASQLRLAVDPHTSDLGRKTLGLATLLERSSDLSNINITANINPSSDMMLSSWVQFDCSKLDFNLGLGKQEAVRRPRFTPFESLMYLMPKSSEGEIAAALSLRVEDMARLKADQEFAKLGRHIG